MTACSFRLLRIADQRSSELLLQVRNDQAVVGRPSSTSQVMYLVAAGWSRASGYVWSRGWLPEHQWRHSVADHGDLHVLDASPNADEAGFISGFAIDGGISTPLL